MKIATFPKAMRTPKPLADMVDFLPMTTFDQGTAILPTEAAGDLLDELVADHLTRENTAPRLTPDDHDPALDISDPPVQDSPPVLSSEERAGMLQREIDALLGSSVADDSTGIMDLPPLEAQAAADSPPAVSPEEMNALLADNPLDIDDVATAKLLEAEGVLAEELAQLTADAALPAPSAAAAEPVAATEKSAEVEWTEAPAVEETTAPLALPPGVPAHPIVELLADAPPAAVPPARRKNRILAFFSAVALIVAQLADIPFQWMDVLDKNLLGVAALIMLLSGLVLKLAAWWLGS